MKEMLVLAFSKHRICEQVSIVSSVLMLRCDDCSSFPSASLIFTDISINAAYSFFDVNYNLINHRL